MTARISFKRSIQQICADTIPLHYTKKHMQHNVCDPNFHKLLKNPKLLEELGSDAFKRAQAGENIPGWSRANGAGPTLPN